MIRTITATLFLVLVTINYAESTVCEEYLNPCQDRKSCESRSDFVFEATIDYIDDLSVISPSFGKGDEQIVQQKTAILGINRWIKGERTFEPTQVSLPTQKFYCSEIKPLLPELKVGQRYVVYGAYYRSPNYCLGYYNGLPAEVKSCKTAKRTEGRVYWLLEATK